jgi:cytohesin
LIDVVKLIRQGDCWAVELLLAHGACADKRDLRSNAALHWAAGFGHLDVVMALLSAGADPNVANGLLETPLHWYNHTGVLRDVCSFTDNPC